MKCKNCWKPISQHMAGNPLRAFWFSPADGSLGDVWCDRGADGVAVHHAPDYGVPDLAVATDVEEWLDA